MSREKIAQLEAALRKYPRDFNKLEELQELAKSLLPVKIAENVSNEIDIVMLEYELGWDELGEHYSLKAADLVKDYLLSCDSSSKITKQNLQLQAAS